MHQFPDLWLEGWRPGVYIHAWQDPEQEGLVLYEVTDNLWGRPATWEEVAAAALAAWGAFDWWFPDPRLRPNPNPVSFGNAGSLCLSRILK